MLWTMVKWYKYTSRRNLLGRKNSRRHNGIRIDHGINQESSTWSEGFWRPSSTFFGIDLLGGYRIQKYEDNEIDIWIKGEGKSFFQYENA